MKYKRLTKSNYDINKIEYPSMVEYKRMFQTLADLEDNIENGTIIKLPCKVGDKVFKENIKEIEPFTITMITQKADKTFKIRLTSDRYKSSHDVLISELGKTVFLTKAEAEQKLKELEK